MPTEEAESAGCQQEVQDRKAKGLHVKDPDRDGEASQPVPTLKTPIDPGTQRGPCDVPKGHQRKAS